MGKRLKYLLLLPLVFLLVACGATESDPLGLIGNTFAVENLRTNKHYSRVTITEPTEESNDTIYAVGVTENGQEDQQVMEISEEPDETGYHLVKWGDKTYYAGRVEEEIYFWFQNQPDELGSTVDRDYVLKLTEE